MAKTPAYGVAAFAGIRMADGTTSSSATEIAGLPAPDPNIPFALTRKSLAPISIVALSEPVIEREARAETDPILDLRRRKSSLSAVAPNAPAAPFAPVTAILEAIRDANDRDSILELLVAGTRTVARKVAVLAVKGDAVVGWTASPEFGERAALRTTRVSPSMSDLFTEALTASTARLVRIPKDAAHAPLLSAMSAPPSGEVALVAIRVEGKAVALVLADEMGDTLIATQRMEELAGVAGESLGRLLRQRRKS